MHHEGPSPATEDDATAGNAAGAAQATPAGPGRRRVMMLGAAAGLGVAGAATLSGCASDSGSSGGAPAGDGAAPKTSATPGTPLAKLSDVPVGGTYAAAGPDERPIVIAQPTAGQVVAFDAACPHAGCKVVARRDTLNCPCHNSNFDPFTGKNLNGPATKPLPPVAVKVSGTDIVTA